MSSAAKQSYLSARLPGFNGRGDKYLGEIARDLRRVLWKTESSFTHSACRLPDLAWSEVAVLLVEWAEDIHNDLGLWRSVESHQRQCFGTPLPFLIAPGEAGPEGLETRRIQYFLWNLWPCFNRELMLSPTDQDLKRLADTASRFLKERIARVPRDSGLTSFLRTPNDFGWEIKRKLLWAGLNSYLFRFLFFKYLEDDEREPDIATKDDFVCQHCTEWAGLGVIDVLAGALDLPESDRATLRTWYERHRSFFRVLARHEERGEVKTIAARNVVNGQTYTIRMNMADCPFEPGMVIYGALTPWRGEWYWSGAQQSFGNMPAHEEANIRRQMLETSSAVAYRFCPDEAEEARRRIKKHHAEFIAHYGGELVSFPDGLALAAAEQNRHESVWAAASPEDVRSVMREHGLNHPRPRMTFPPDVLNHDQGIAMFFNPDEGQEIILYFNQVLSGFRKKGQGLTEDELRALRGLVRSPGVSPAFVRRLATEHGAESIAETFLLRDFPPEWSLEVLLRRHKGHFYRKRYPSLSVRPPSGSSAEMEKGKD